MTSPVDPARDGVISDGALSQELAELLNGWNRRYDAEAMLCSTGRHGPMHAVDDPHTGRLWWLCEPCGNVQPVTTDQITVALGSADLPEPPGDPHESAGISMPEGMPGDRGDYTVRIPLCLGSAHAPLRLTPAQITGGLAGAALGVGLYWWLPLPGAFAVIYLLLPLLLAIVVGLRYPAARVLQEHLIHAADLEPGDWVRLGAWGSAAGRATRVVQLRGLGVNHRCYPGVEVLLLTGARIQCRLDDGWLMLDLA